MTKEEKRTMQSRPSGSPTAGPAKAGEPLDLSRRLALAAGAASALMATGRALSAGEASAASPQDPSNGDIPVLLCPPHVGTVVTPPRTMAQILQLQTIQIQKTSSPFDTIDAEVLPFRIRQQVDGSVVHAPGPDEVRMRDFVKLSEEQLRDTVVCSLLSRFRYEDSGSRWKDNVGVGPSRVVLYADPARLLPLVKIDIPGVPLQTIQDSIFHMKTDCSRMDQIKMEVDYPHIYLATALSVDQNLKNRTWTCHAINCAAWFATQVVRQVKAQLQVPRPQAIMSTAPAAIIPVPPYTAYPGGHATFLSTLHVVLTNIVGAPPAEASLFRGLSDRISENRERAGLHTRVDTRAGQEFGTALGEALVDCAERLCDPFWAYVYGRARKEWPRSKA